jgi:RNA polymerase sigma factor (sigma-70 family)
MPSALPAPDDFAAWTQEYERLVRLCAAYTGTSVAAEDLAQETLYEAWRHQDRLRDAAGRSQWLAAIARNVCRRWQARRHTDLAHYLSDDDAAWITEPADPLDLQSLAEQGELARLLERALALLPPVTQQALVAHAINEQPFAEIAARVGLTENAVKVQVHRGKARLRQIFATTLRDDALACGLGTSWLESWQQSTLWCPLCGTQHMQARWDAARGKLELRCPACYPTNGVYCSYDEMPELFASVSSLKAAFNRVMRWVNVAYQPGNAQSIRCECGRMPALYPSMPQTKSPLYADMPDECYRRITGMHLRCPSCGILAAMRLSNFALYLPDPWRFWRAHPRLRMLPDQAIIFAGQSATQIRLQSLTDSAHCDVIFAADTYAVLAVQSNVANIASHAVMEVA